MNNPVSSQVLNLMKTVFAPSMFIAISHLSYPVRKFSDCRIFPVALDALPPNLVRGRDYSYGHTVNESLAVLREVEKLTLSIPLAISFSLKGVYYVPRLAQPVLTQDHQYELFQPCQDHEMPYYEDPKGLHKVVLNTPVINFREDSDGLLGSIRLHESCEANTKRTF
ncbi:uncharacterized protein LOC142768315 [Rhipicephalus microplus]|uniref:uncharacterized protein LOC142768315 n=1 Tax=Rhipicephalus microplus TaxID=6941 RepID=UPI003F6D06B8